MSMTLGELATDLIEHMGEEAGVDTDTNKTQNAIRRAIRAGFPWFYKPVSDVTTFTGAGTLARNTASIAVPATFYSSGVGRVTQILARMNDGTVNANPTFPGWFSLENGVWVDDMNGSSPKIWFSGTLGAPVELMIYGIRPLLVPNGAGETIEGSDWPGYISYLLEAGEMFARKPLVRAGAYDPEANTQRLVMAQQDVTDIAARCRMKPVYEAIFRR